MSNQTGEFHSVF